jgi:hypothetical protein
MTSPTRPDDRVIDLARDAAFLLDPGERDMTVTLMVTAIAYMAAHPRDDDEDGRLLERAARARWRDGIPHNIRARLGLPVVVGYHTPSGPACLDCTGCEPVEIPAALLQAPITEDEPAAAQRCCSCGGELYA